MKRSEVREHILRTAYRMIAENGIRAVRIDDIANEIAVSKRTLYELFPDRTTLIATCCSHETDRLREEIGRVAEDTNKDAFERLTELFDVYVRSIYSVSGYFLSEIRGRAECMENHASMSRLWLTTFSTLLTKGIEAGWIIAGTESGVIAEHVLTTTYETRIKGVAEERQRTLFTTLIRGIATPAGAARLEELRNA